MKSLISAILFTASLGLAQTSSDFEKKYLDEGAKLLTLINTKKADEKTTEAAVKVLVQNAHGIMDLYAAKYPESKKLLTFLKDNTKNLETMPLDKIQDDWHDAKILTKDKVGLDLKSEDNEKYLDPCHIMIHPLMVLAAVKVKNFDAAKEELVEGMEQMKLTKKQVDTK